MFNKYNSETNFQQYKEDNTTGIFSGDNIVMYRSKLTSYTWSADTWMKRKLYPKVTSYSKYSWRFYINKYRCDHKSVLHNIMRDFCYKEYIINEKAYYLDYNDPINLKHLILRYNEE